MAVSLIDVRRDDELDCELTLNPEDPYLFRPNANPALIAETAAAAAGLNNTTGKKAGSSRQTTTHHASHRMNTVPLQMLVRMRTNLSASLDTQINSFEVPQSARICAHATCMELLQNQRHVPSLGPTPAHPPQLTHP